MLSRNVAIFASLVTSTMSFPLTIISSRSVISNTLSTFYIPSSLAKRFVPIPPPTYIHAAKLSTKAIILITIFALVTTIISTCTCYICIKRRRSRNRARRLAKERAESKQLKPRINKRNARFFAPGLVMDKLERDRLRDQRETKRAWEGKREQYEMWKMEAGGVYEDEVRRPEKTRGGWRDVMRGVVVRK